MMKSTLELRKEKGILVAAHRGTSEETFLQIQLLPSISH